MPTFDIAWAIESVKGRWDAYELAQSYDCGDHRLAFATLKWQNTFGQLFREFADNMCDDVVDGLSDRLQVTAWTCDDDGVAAAMDDIWERNRGASRLGQVHRNGYREGDGFLMVQQDKEGLARFHPQRPEQMAVRYSTENPDEVEVVGKVWKDGRRYRLNLYYPDHREKYATKGVGLEGGIPQAKAFQPLDPSELGKDEGDMATAIVPVREGIPAWHYPNGTLSEYGRSVLANVIPLQDALNKSVLDMLVAMEFLSYPQRWATGIQVERDPVTGEEKSPFRSGAERMWRVGSKDATMGQFDAASMDNFLEVQDGFRLEIARKGMMSPGTIAMRSGVQTPPAGVALLVMDGKAIKTSRDRQRDWGHNHREAMAWALNLEGHTGVTSADIDVEWAPPETRDEKELLETLILKRDLGVPDRQLLLEYGYDVDEVTEWLNERQGEDEAAREAALVASAGRVAPTTLGVVRTLTGAAGGQENGALGIQAPPDTGTA